MRMPRSEVLHLAAMELAAVLPSPMAVKNFQLNGALERRGADVEAFPQVSKKASRAGSPDCGEVLMGS